MPYYRTYNIAAMTRKLEKHKWEGRGRERRREGHVMRGAARRPLKGFVSWMSSARQVWSDMGLAAGGGGREGGLTSPLPRERAEATRSQG